MPEEVSAEEQGRINGSLKSRYDSREVYARVGENGLEYFSQLEELAGVLPVRGIEFLTREAERASNYLKETGREIHMVMLYQRLCDGILDDLGYSRANLFDDSNPSNTSQE